MTQLVGINAIYFKANWKHAFKEKNTKINKFINSSNQELTLNFMNQTEMFPYYENNEIQLIELPYHNDIFSFGIFLPRQDNNYRVSNNFTNYIQHMVMRNIEIYLPKFNQKCNLELRTLFEQLNCKRMFEMANAEFYNIIKNKDGLHVSNLVHEAVIIVDEKGTEVAAATSAVFTNSVPERALIFNTNHTFQYYIRHIPSNTIIFYGVFDGQSI